MDDFDLNLLRAFDAIWRHGHLGRAAEELGVSQPGLSHSLKRLRAQLGDVLFVKVRSGVQPSARAVQLAPVVHSILSDVRTAILTPPRFDPAQARRRFIIAMSDLGELVFLPRLFERLSHEAPHAELRTVSLPPRDLAEAIARGEVDLALGYFPDLDGTDLLRQRLFDYGFACLARKGHPLVEGRLTQQLYLKLSHAFVQTESRSQEIVERYLKEHGIERREVLRCPHFLSIPAVIAATDLIVTVPKLVGEVFAKMAEIQVLEPPFPFPFYDAHQHWHRSQHDDPGNRWLRSLVHAIFAR